MPEDEFEISIIIPVHNNGKNIGECLNSIIRQTISKRIEIICVNDGSTDESVEIIEKYKGSNTNIVLLNQEKSGPGVARNSGLNAARGHYVMFMDGDDFYATEYAVEKLYNSIIQNNMDVCFGNMLRLYKGRIVNGFEHSRKYSNFSYEGELKTNRFPYPFIHVLCIYNREFLINNKLRYPDRKRGQDVVFCANVLGKTPTIYHINTPIYVHRIKESKRKLEYEKAVDYTECWKTIITGCGDNDLRKKYSKLASIELRIFAFLGWYEQIDKNNDWKRIEDINRLLRQEGAEELLGRKEWQGRSFPYKKEMLGVFIYRLGRLVQKEFYYCFCSSKYISGT